MTLLVTCCVGFIGSNFVLGWRAQSSEPIANLDKLRYEVNVQRGGDREGFSKQYGTAE